MKELTAKEKKDLRIEIKARKIVIKKLTTAMSALQRTIDGIKEDRENRAKAISEYKNEDEIADAYGWGFITEEEYDKRLDAYRNGIEAIAAEESAEEIAADMLAGWRNIMESDIASLEFDLLPPQKQQEIVEKNYEIAMKRAERKTNQHQ